MYESYKKHLCTRQQTRNGLIFASFYHAPLWMSAVTNSDNFDSLSGMSLPPPNCEIPHIYLRNNNNKSIKHL